MRAFGYVVQQWTAAAYFEQDNDGCWMAHSNLTFTAGCRKHCCTDNYVQITVKAMCVPKNTEFCVARVFIIIIS